MGSFDHWEKTINDLIAAGDRKGLLKLEFQTGGACGCMGPQDDDPVCPCGMATHMIRAMIDIDALVNGEIVRTGKAVKISQEERQETFDWYYKFKALKVATIKEYSEKKGVSIKEAQEFLENLNPWK